nr:reverse transcriptase domain-containing protein [Tanacetum cinerariifolium]
MTEAQIHYTTTEKEMLAVVYAFEKFRPYLVLSKSIVYTDHSGSENLAADHLSRLENPHQDVLEIKDINENFPLKTLGSLTSNNTSWFTDIVNFHVRNFIKKGLTSQQKKKFSKMKLLKFSKLAMRDLLGAIMVPISQRRRDREKYLREMRCLKTISKFVKGNKYILVAVDYLSKWVEAKALPTNDARAYENFVIYKERMKKLHDSKIKNRIFNIGDQALLFNSRLKIFFGKLKTHWSGPFTITHIFPYGTIELSQPNGPNFKALLFNSRLKIFFGKLKTHWSGPFTITHIFPYGTIELSQPNGPNFKSKLGNIEHDIGSLHQKPDQRAFFYNNQATKAKCQKIESSRAILAIYPKTKPKENVKIQMQGLKVTNQQSLDPGTKAANV